MTFRNPFRGSVLAIFVLGTHAMLVFAVWLTDRLVWSRALGATLVFAALAWALAALERRVHDDRVRAHERASLARDERIRDARDAMFYRTLRARAMLDPSGNLTMFSPTHMPTPLVRTDGEREKFDNIVAGWTRDALLRDEGTVAERAQ